MVYLRTVVMVYSLPQWVYLRTVVPYQQVLLTLPSGLIRLLRLSTHQSACAVLCTKVIAPVVQLWTLYTPIPDWSMSRTGFQSFTTKGWGNPLPSEVSSTVWRSAQWRIHPNGFLFGCNYFFTPALCHKVSFFCP